MAPNNRKRPRERPTVDSEMFAIYEDLASETEAIRIQASIRLCTRIKALENGDEALDTILRRLIKGLCSSRKGARLGFTIALTEFLLLKVGGPGQIEKDHVLRLIEQLTKAPTDAAGQESRDYYIGQVFAAEALAGSGILFTGDAEDIVRWNSSLTALVSLAKKKPWLRETCCSVCLRSLNHAGPGGELAKRAHALLQTFVDQGLINTPEGVALWLTVSSTVPDSSLPKGVFVDDDPLASSNRKLLVRILKEEEVPAQRGSRVSAPHFAWGLIFSNIVTYRSRLELAQYWRELVDEGLFAASSSPERKQSAFLLFADFVSELDADCVPALLSRNILVNINQQLSTKKGYLHQVADKAVQAVLDRARKDPVIVQPVVEHLLADEATRKLALNPILRGKLLEKLIACVDLENAHGVVDALLAPLRSKKSSTLSREPTHDSLLTLTVTRIRSLPYPQSADQGLKSTRKTYRHLLKSLAEAAYFNKGASKSTDEKSGTADDSEFYQTQLTNALANLLIKEHDPSYYYIQIAKALGELQEQHPEISTLDDQVQARIDSARARVVKLAKTTDDSEAASHLRALALLFSVCIVQVYNADVDALEALDDLQECYSSITAGESAEAQENAANAIVEVVLSFTSKPATMFRNLAQKAFGLCSDMVTAEGLESMIEVLRSEESSAGQDQMFEQRDDEEGPEEDDDDDEEDEEDNEGTSGEVDSDSAIDGADDSDVEMLDGDAEAEADDSDEEGSSSSSGDSDDDASDASDAELSAFDAKLALALGTRRADTDLAHTDPESSDPDMSDSEMEALDGHLSLMFKQRAESSNAHKSRRKDAAAAKQNMVVFKTRVLELLKIYIAKQVGGGSENGTSSGTGSTKGLLALDLVVPLVELVSSTRNAKVRVTAVELLNAFFKRVKLVRKEGVQSDKKVRKRARALLDEVHGLVASKRSKPLQAACSRASLLLVKLYLANGGKVEEVEKVYEETKTRVNGKNERFTGDFFAGWEDWYRSAKGDLGR